MSLDQDHLYVVSRGGREILRTMRAVKFLRYIEMHPYAVVEEAMRRLGEEATVEVGDVVISRIRPSAEELARIRSRDERKAPPMLYIISVDGYEKERTTVREHAFAVTTRLIGNYSYRGVMSALNGLEEMGYLEIGSVRVETIDITELELQIIRDELERRKLKAWYDRNQAKASEIEGRELERIRQQMRQERARVGLDG